MKRIAVCLLTILTFGFVQAQDYDFSIIFGNNTLYFYISSTRDNTVELAFPGPSEENPWAKHAKPSGKLVIPEQVTYDSITYTVAAIGYNVFSDCKGLTSVTIPATVKSFGEFAFKGCKNLLAINIPDGVAVIPEGLFMDCKELRSIILPESVRNIQLQAFDGCSGLEDIYVYSTNPPLIDEESFGKVSLDIPLHVPASAIEVYKKTEGWRQFRNIKE